MSCVILVSQRGAIVGDETVGPLEGSVELLSGGLTTSYSVAFDPAPFPQRFSASIIGQRRNIEVSSDFAIDLVCCPDGADPTTFPPIRLRPPVGGAIGYSWQMAGTDGVLYAKLP